LPEIRTDLEPGMPQVGWRRCGRVLPLKLMQFSGWRNSLQNGSQGGSGRSDAVQDGKDGQTAKDVRYLTGPSATSFRGHWTSFL
jgi:hypothetical protein